MLSHIYATVAHFFVKALRNITKAVHNFFALIEFVTLPRMQPLWA